MLNSTSILRRMDYRFCSVWVAVRMSVSLAPVWGPAVRSGCRYAVCLCYLCLNPARDGCPTGELSSCFSHYDQLSDSQETLIQVHTLIIRWICRDGGGIRIAAHTAVQVWICVCVCVCEWIDNNGWGLWLWGGGGAVCVYGGGCTHTPSCGCFSI